MKFISLKGDTLRVEHDGIAIAKSARVPDVVRACSENDRDERAYYIAKAMREAAADVLCEQGRELSHQRITEMVREGIEDMRRKST